MDNRIKRLDAWDLEKHIKTLDPELDFSIEDNIIETTTKKEFSLYNFKLDHKKATPELLKTIEDHLLKLFPKLDLRHITRQYKYAPELKQTYLAIRYQ